MKVLTHSHAPPAAMRVQTWESATRRGCCVCPPGKTSASQKEPAAARWENSQGACPGDLEILGDRASRRGAAVLWEPPRAQSEGGREGSLRQELESMISGVPPARPLVHSCLSPAETFLSHQQDFCQMGQCEVEANVWRHGGLCRTGSQQLASWLLE